LYNWIDITRGPYGIAGIPKPDLLSPKFCNACIKIVGKCIILKEFNKANYPAHRAG